MKKILFYLFFASAICIQTNSIIAQESTEVSDRINYKHGLGMAAGFTTGYGLSYRYCPSRWTIQGTFAPYKSDYSKSLSLGIAFMYNVVETRTTSFFVYEGNHYRYNEVLDNSTNIYPEDNKHQWNNGLGIGIEFLIFKRVSFNLMGGYASYDAFREINVTGETGLFYKF